MATEEGTVEKTNGTLHGKVVEMGAEIRRMADQLYESAAGKGTSSVVDQAMQARARAISATQEAEAHLLWLVEHA